MPFRLRPRAASALSRGRVWGENILGGKDKHVPVGPEIRWLLSLFFNFYNIVLVSAYTIT